MKAVLGLLFLMVGLTVGYLVITGKLPNPTPTPPTSSGNPVVPNTQQNLQNRQKLIQKNSMGSGGPTGLPTMTHMHDVAASSGGMR